MKKVFAFLAVLSFAVVALMGCAPSEKTAAPAASSTATVEAKVSMEAKSVVATPEAKATKSTKATKATKAAKVKKVNIVK